MSFKEMKIVLVKWLLDHLNFWSHMPVCNVASDWPRTFYIPGVFVFFCK